MSMLELTKAELNKHNALSPELNDFTQQIVNAIPFQTVHPRMKVAVAVSQLSAFASQFKRNILLWDGSTEVPLNSITFIVKGSGYGGDSSVNSARKCFKSGYELIENERKARTIKLAIKSATDAGEELPTQVEVYKNYMKPIPPIDVMITTEPGLIQHINDIGQLELSAPYLYSGEFSDELAYNPDMTSNIKVISETYDLGVKQAKYTKGVEFRSGAIEGEPVSALFIGSPGHVLYDDATRRKFDVAFMSKLARRSFFCYVPEKISEPVFDSISEMLNYEESIEVEAKQARASMQDTILNITKFGIATSGQPIKTTPEVFELFSVYKRYNNDYVDALPNQDSTYALIRRHLQWKALKLAGGFALLDQSEEVKAHHYIDAIRICELFDQDMIKFEHDLNKSTHERFSDFIQTLTDTEGKASVNVHDIKKMGFINSASQNKLQELITLAAGYDPDGLYALDHKGGSISYKKVIKTDIIGISYKAIDNSIIDTAVATKDPDKVSAAKRKVASMTANGFSIAETTFPELADLLSGDYAYTPFKLKDGIRGKDHILGGAKWLVLDVDTTLMTAEEAHFMLSSLNHHIALSSDPSNHLKYRIIIELDSQVELDAKEWSRFYLAIAEDLGLRVDPLPQSQIFFSYSNRTIYTNLEGEPLCVRDYVMKAKEEVEKPIISYTKPQMKSLLNDPLHTFVYCYESALGTGSLNMYKMIQHAKDLGATLEDIHELIDDVNEYWDTDQGAMPSDRIDKIKQQVSSLF